MFHGVGDIRLDDVPEPKLQKPNDAIVRLTASAICGTDLHFERGTVGGIKPCTILGHEGVGIVEEVGSAVRNFKKGDRVVIASTIACGNCLLPRRLLRAVRQGQSQRSRCRHRIFWRPEKQRSLRWLTGRVRAQTWASSSFPTRCPTSRRFCFPTSSPPATSAPTWPTSRQAARLPSLVAALWARSSSPVPGLRMRGGSSPSIAFRRGWRWRATKARRSLISARKTRWKPSRALPAALAWTARWMRWAWMPSEARAAMMTRRPAKRYARSPRSPASAATTGPPATRPPRPCNGS